MRAVGYFSSNLPGSPSQRSHPSLSDQNDAFLDACRVHGYEATASFIDADIRSDCPGLRQMLAFLQRPAPDFCIVVVQAFSHLGASQIDAIRTFYEITELGASVLSLEEGAIDDERIIQFWNDAPSGHLGKQVREAMRRRAVSGAVLGRPPFGYRVGPDRRLEIVENEAALVRHIFHLYLEENLGVRRIARRLNEEGYRTRRGGNWSMVSIRDILRNRVYVGTYTRFGITVPGSHNPIVTEDQFRAVQARLQERRTATSKRNPSRYLLSGLAHCGDCGNRMIGVSRKQQWRRGNGDTAEQAYRYYQCESRTNQSVCDYHTRRADDLEAEVVGHIKGHEPGAVHPSVIRAGDEQAVAAGAAQAAARTRGRLRSLDRRLSEQLNRLADNRISRHEFRATANALVRERRRAADELRAQEQRTSVHAFEVEQRQYFDRQVERIRTSWDQLSFDARQSTLRELVERVIVCDDGITTVLRG